MTTVYSDIGVVVSKPSKLREYLNNLSSFLLEESEVNNLSIGNPSFVSPLAELWAQEFANVVEQEFQLVAGKYSLSRGNPDLIQEWRNFYNKKYSTDVKTEEIVIGPGSQMLIFCVVNILCGICGSERRNLVLPILPDYSGYFSLSLNRTTVVGLSPLIEVSGDRGFTYKIDFKALESLRNIGAILLSNPMNPTGKVLSEDELSQLIDIAVRKDCFLIIDNAYGNPIPKVIDYCHRPLVHERVINLFSLSKAGLPGERLGIMMGDNEVLNKVSSFLSNSMLHSSQLPQVVLKNLLKGGRLEDTMSNSVTPYYKEKYDYAHSLLLAQLPPGLSWRLYSGHSGMFIWIWIDEPGFDCEEFYEMLKKNRKTIIMPGSFFFDNEDRIHSKQCIRVSVVSSKEEIARGVVAIAKELSNYVD